MLDMKSAPRDRTRVLIKHNVLLFHFDYREYYVAGDCWQEMWFDGHDWQPWSGKYSTTSTACISDDSVHLLGWCPVEVADNHQFSAGD